MLIWHRWLLGAVLASALLSCAPPPEKARLGLTPVSFGDLPGWFKDTHSAALVAFLKSCGRPLPSQGQVLISLADWSVPCEAARKIAPNQDNASRKFFETWFQPYRATNGDQEDGLITGYFEAELRGARQSDARFNVPLYRLPKDHVAVDLSKFDPELSGKHIVGRVENGKLQPYHARGEIENGALAQRGLELLWIDNEIDAFVLHVQGSGRVILPDGDVVRVGFAGHNGLAYRSIGRQLIKSGALLPGAASWNDIRTWIENNPDQAASLFAVNKRFIFFREVDGEGPIGAAGIPLTPRRSLAVDHRHIPYGVPIWLDTTWPNKLEQPLRQLMVAQDTGSAIRGPVRGDFFWGYGPKALAFAGKMKSRGRYFLLLPRSASLQKAGS